MIPIVFVDIGTGRGTRTLLIVALLTSCAGGSDRSGGPVVRDSAGMRIVENTGPAWSTETAWRLGAAPSTDIGGGVTDDQQLFDVRGAVRLSDGRVVVANGGSHELRLYAADGSHVSSSGGRGAGPSEFEQLAWVRTFATDSLVAYDSRLRRISVYGADGRLDRTVLFRPHEDRGFPQLADVFGDGTFLSQFRIRLDPNTPGGVVRQPIHASRYSADLTTKDSLGTFLGTEFFLLVFPDDIDAVPLVFGRSTAFRVRGDRVYVAVNDTYEIQVWGSDGRLRTVIRREHDPVPVTQEAFDRVRKAELEGLDGYLRARAARLYDAMPVPLTFPAYGEILVDALDNLWVREYDTPGDEKRRWTVFDAGGSMLGSLDVGERLDPLQVGEDFILGTWRDDLDVEHVQVYRLIKP